MPPRRSIIGSAVDGRIIQMLVREGDAVHTSQMLAQLRTGTLAIELTRTQAELELRKQEMAELTNGSRPEEIARAKALVAGARARSDYSENRLRRARRTYERGAVLTLDQLEEVVSQTTVAAQDLIAAQADYQMMQEGPRRERIAQAAARIAMQVELVRQIEDRIALHTLKAPFDGYVVARHNEVGGWASSGEPIVEIIELDPVEVEVFVSEDFIAYVTPGMRAEVALASLPGKPLLGEVVHVVPQADLRSRTFPVKVQLRNPAQNNQPLIKAGMFARVLLATESSQERLLVPKDSLVLKQNGQQRLVYVIEPPAAPNDPSRVRPVAVELGVSEGGWIEVIGDIQEGQSVVVKGNERLRPGQAVSIAP